jgi:hypothetical protein
MLGVNRCGPGGGVIPLVVVIAIVFVLETVPDGGLDCEYDYDRDYENAPGSEALAMAERLALESRHPQARDGYREVKG